MKFKIPLLIAACIIAGCAHRIIPVATVKIDSDPQGMRVFYGEGGTPEIAQHGREFIGTTPCTINIQPDSDGRFSLDGIRFYNRFVRPTAVFMAEPPFDSTNLFKQSVTYHGGARYQTADKVPQGVFFDMHTP